MAKSILIIEDDKNIAELERDYLEANGYEVDTKLNGESGLEAALKQNYNLILLDLMLPGMDGFEICRCIRREKDIPILMVSAKKEDIDKIRGFGIGADDYIVKPFSPSELVARVHAHIARYDRLTAKGEGTADDYISIGNLYIDKNARRVYVNKKEAVLCGEALQLTKTEFEILRLLLENEGRVFSRAEILRRIWNNDAEVLDRTVDVNITRLRKKLDGYGKFVVTRLGYGYCFDTSVKD